MNRTCLAGAERGVLVAVLGLGLCALHCGSSSSQPGAPGMSKAGSGSAQAGAGNSAGSGATGSGAAGSPATGSSGSSGSAGDGGAPAAPGGSGVSGSMDSQAGAPDPGPPADPETLLYVFSQQKLPTKKADYARDLDGDGTADNQYGSFAATFEAQGVDLQAIDDQATAAGLGLQLLSLTVRDSNLVTSTGASSALSRAVTHAMPDFGGMGSFMADSAVPSATLTGAIASGTFKSGALALGSTPPKLLMRLEFGLPVDVPVEVYALSYHVAADGLTVGQLNGAMLATDVDMYVPPTLAKSLNDGCTAQPSGQNCKTALALFDTDNNNVVSADEVRANSIVKALLAPDVKLLDAQGHYAPSKTGTKESYSIGIGFSAVSAQLAP